MAAYDLEEQEQLEDLKAWWKQWGNTISGVIIAVCVGVIAVQAWRWWSAEQAERASVLYSAVATAARSNDVAKAKDAMAQLADKYGSTGYAARGSLLLAATLYEAGDKAGAKAQLASVIDRDSEPELKEIARLRLAALLMDDKQYDEALRTLDAKHDAAFDAIYADMRGDVLVAAGRNAEARTAYQTALARIDPKSPYRNYVQVKLDTLGGAAAPGVAPPGAANAAAVTADGTAAQAGAATGGTAPPATPAANTGGSTAPAANIGGPAAPAPSAAPKK